MDGDGGDAGVRDEIVVVAMEVGGRECGVAGGVCGDGVRERGCGFR